MPPAPETTPEFFSTSGIFGRSGPPPLPSLSTTSVDGEQTILSSRSGQESFQKDIQPNIDSANQAAQDSADRREQLRLAAQQRAKDAKLTQQKLSSAEIATLTDDERTELGLATRADEIRTRRIEIIDRQREQADAAYESSILALREQAAVQTDFLRTQWNERKDALEESNRIHLSTINQALLRTGTSEYSPIMSSGFLSDVEQKGIQKLKGLDLDYSRQLAQVNSALKRGEFQLAAERTNELLALEDRALNLIEANAKEAARINQEVREKLAAQQAVQQDRDRQNLVGDLAALSGTLNPLDLHRALRSQGYDITPDEVSSVVNNMRVAEKALPGIVGEWQAAIQNDPTLQGMSLSDYMTLKDPTRALDVQEQQLRIQKLQKDLTSVGSNADALEALAFAQQYAATGKIPTGMPKGTFGIVAETAKTLPKPLGTIVSNTTGIRSDAVSDAKQDGYATMYSVIQLSKDLKELDKERFGGIISGTVGKIFGSADQQRYIDLRDQISDLIARARTGAAINSTEEKRYYDLLPGRFDEPLGLGADSQDRIDNFISTISKDLQNKTTAQGLAIYGFTTIEIGGNEYTVGDTITNAQGQIGRVLPDGQIVLLE